MVFYLLGILYFKAFYVGSGQKHTLYIIIVNWFEEISFSLTWAHHKQSCVGEVKLWVWLIMILAFQKRCGETEHCKRPIIEWNA